MSDLQVRTVRVGLLATGTVLLTLLAYWLLPGHAGVPGLPFGLLLGAAAVGAAAIGVLPWSRLARGRTGLWVLTAWSLTDISLIAALVAISGGGHSPLWVLWALTTLFFAASYPPRVQLVLLAVTGVAYGVASDVAGTPPTAAQAVLCLASLFTVWLLAAFLSRELQQETAAHRRAQAESAARAVALEESLHELEQAQHQLLAAERLAAIGEVAADVAHQVRNPLGVISNALYLLEHELAGDGPAPARRHLRTANRELSAATVVIANLLEYARPRTPLRLPLPLAGLLEAAATSVPPPSGIELSVDVGLDLPTLQADADQLLHVLRGLLDEAYDAVAEGGRVEVGAQVRAGLVEVWVTDSGREPAAPSQLAATVRHRIVAAHDGTIRTEPLPEGGRRVTISLPLPVGAPLPRQPLPPASVDTAP